MLDDLKMIHQRDSCDILGTASRSWQKVSQAMDWSPHVATKHNLAKQLALELMGKAVIIYGEERLSTVANAWKRYINLYAKQLAWKGELSDAEIVGWTKQPVNKLYAVVELRSGLETELVRERAAVVERLLSGMRPSPIVVDAEGHTAEEQAQYCQALGEFVALYLALLNGIDPSDRGVLDKVNRELA